MEKANILLDLQANSLKKEQRRQLVELLKAFPLEIAGKRPVAEAIITSGGIKISEVDPNTMQSKIIYTIIFFIHISNTPSSVHIEHLLLVVQPICTQG